MLGAVTITLLIAVWFALSEGKDNPIPETHPQGQPAKRKVTHNALLEARLKLLEEMRKGDANYKLKVPIEFYGRVLDQHDKPVIGAKVEIRLNSINGITNHDIFTGGDGTFALAGVSGRYITVNIYGLEGYTGVQSTGSGDYNYAEPGEFKFHVPNPEKPVVFRLWKYEKSEPLNRKTIFSSVKPDGTIGWFDLKSGMAGTGGLGVIVIDLSPKNGKEVQVTYKLIGGEGCSLLETNDDPMFTAPVGGFQKEIIHEVHWKEGDASQVDPGKFRFYFRDADGSYAAVNASLRFASDVKCEVFFHSLQNPSGSRNLEYDPRLEIK